MNTIAFLAIHFGGVWMLSTRLGHIAYHLTRRSKSRGEAFGWIVACILLALCCATAWNEVWAKWLLN